MIGDVGVDLPMLYWELMGECVGLDWEALSCCGLGIWLLVVVEADGLGLVLVDLEGVWGCDLEDREGLGMQMAWGLVVVAGEQDT